MRAVTTSRLIVVLLLHHFSKTDADGASSTIGLNTDLDCGPTLFSNASGLIVLPRNPTGKKGTSVNCTYVIFSNRTSEISLNVSSIDRQRIEESFSNCFNDSITISCISGNSSSATYCLAEQSVKRSNPSFGNCRFLKMSVLSENYNINELIEIQYSLIEENECGNTSFSGPTGVVTSPRFPLSYPHNLKCIYSIEVGSSKSISIAFLSFSLEGTSKTPGYDSCIHDYLTISCLSEIPSPGKLPAARKYCGQKTKPPKFTFSDCAHMILNLVSDSSINQGGFKLQYTSPVPELECGQTLFTNSSGVITMPSNPTDFLAKVNCTYTISANSLTRISLGASGLLMKNYIQFFKDCSKETLTVTCVSNFTTSRRFCASSPLVELSTMLTSCQRLTFSIQSTQYEYRGLFRMTYIAASVDEACGIASYSGSIGFITSPRFPLSYQHGLNCVYTIAVGRMKTVELHFISFFLEGTSSTGICIHDWLTISCLSDGSIAPTDLSSIKKHCGRKATIEMVKFSDCDAVLLNFVTDSTVTHGGFKIQYTIKQTGNSTYNDTDTNLPDLDCGDTAFTNSTGVITLPSNPTGYLTRVNCSYTISTDRRSKISVNISLTEMRKLVDSFRNCTNENLTVGCVTERTPSFSSARVFCQSTFSRTYPFLLTQMTFPNCQKLRISVRSSNYDYRGTFRISYTAVANDIECGNTSFTDPTGVIASPRFPLSYPHSLNCPYSIDIGVRETISIRFLSFNIEGVSSVNGTDTCIHDWLTMSCLSEGSTEANPPSNRKYCGLKSTPLKFSFANCSTLMLNFVTDASVTRGGFLAQYKVTPSLEVVCGIPVYHRPSGVITSSWNYPDYGDSFNCTYVINATEPSSISLTIWSISPKSSVGRNCQSDWLLMTCLDDQTELDHKVNHRSCNYLNSSTELTFPTCTAVLLVFHRESESTGTTFRIEYTVDDNAMTLKTDLPTTSVLTTQRTVETRSSCATGCEMSSDATYCECITTQQTASGIIQSDTTTVKSVQTTSDSIHPVTIAVSSDVNITARTTIDVIQPLTTAISSSVPSTVPNPSSTIQSETTTSTSDKPISQTTKCGIECREIIRPAGDQSTCNCPSTQSGEVIANTPLSSTADAGQYSFLIPIALAVIVVIVVIFVLLLLLRKRFRSQEEQEILLEEMEEDILHVGSGNGDATTSRSPMSNWKPVLD